MDVQTLMGAIDAGEAGAVASLLEAGADANARSSGGEPALMRAAAKGRLEVVGALLERGADVNAARPDGMTALTLAAFFGHAEVVRALVEAGADVSARDRRGQTALNWAASKGNAEVVRFLRGVEPRGQAAREAEGRTKAKADGDKPAAERAITRATTMKLAGAHETQTRAGVAAAASSVAATNAAQAEVTGAIFEQRTESTAPETAPGSGARATRDERVFTSVTTGAASADAFSASVDAFSGRGSVAARRGGVKSSSRKGVYIAAACAVALLAGGALAYRVARVRSAAPAASFADQPAQKVEPIQAPPAPEQLAPQVDPNAVPALSPDGQNAGTLPATPAAGVVSPLTAPPPTATVNNGGGFVENYGGGRSAPAPLPGARRGGGEPEVVELSRPDEATDEPPRRANRGARREENVRPAATTSAPSAEEPARRADEARGATPRRAEVEDTSPASMIAPKASASPKKKVIQWP